jgi:hypothetical protein
MLHNSVIPSINSALLLRVEPSTAHDGRKTRTHLKGAAAQDKSTTNAQNTSIMKHGQGGSSISQLVRDMYEVMGQILFLAQHGI